MQFKGERLVIPAGPLKVRSNDCDYRFRPHSGFAHLTGLGVDHEPDAVLILEPVAEGKGDDGGNHRATLYFRPLAGRDTEQFYADSRSGEFWIGARPTLAEFKARLGLDTADIGELELAITKNVGAPEIGGISIRLVRKVDENIDALVDTARYNTAKDPENLDLGVLDALDEKLTEALSELRLLKDEWEIEQMKIAVAATVQGFTEVVKALPRALTHQRGERVVEGAFFARAREEGNELGYDTIAASGNNATVLHWTRNTGKVNAGELLLLDAGVEADSLYTADITRTLPANGTFTDDPAQGLRGGARRRRRRLCRRPARHEVPRHPHRGHHRAGGAARRMGPAAGLRRGSHQRRGPAAPPLDAARHQPPPGPGRPRLRPGQA